MKKYVIRVIISCWTKAVFRITNQNKNDFFHHFYLIFHMPASSSFHPLCVTTSLSSHTLVLPHFLPCQLNSTPWMHHPLPPSVLPRPGLTAPSPPPVPCQAGRLWEGSKAWEYPTGGRGSAHGSVAAGLLSVHPQDAPLQLQGWSFLKAGYRQQPRSRQEFKGLEPGCWCLSVLWEVQQVPLNYRPLIDSLFS